MEFVVAPIRIGDTGPQVGNLQDALLLLLDRGVIASFESPNRPSKDELAELAQVLAEEQARTVFGEATHRLVLYLQVQEGLGDDLDGEVESRTARRLNEILRRLGAFDVAQGNVVRGTAWGALGPLAGVVVRAFDRDLRREELLGEARTNEDGAYEIRYSAKRYARAEASGPDLQIRAFDSEALDRLLAEAGPVFNAPSDVTVDLTVATAAAPPSELEASLARILPLLQGQADDGGDLPVFDMTDPDITFLVAESGESLERLTAIRDSATLAQETGGSRIALRARAGPRAGDLHTEVPPAAFYAWLRGGLPNRLEEIVAVDPAQLREILDSAQESNRIPTLGAETTNAIVDRIRAMRAERLLKPAAPNEPPSFGDLLKVSVSDDKLDAFAIALVDEMPDLTALRANRDEVSDLDGIERSARLEAFWSALEDDPLITSEDVNSAKRVLELDRLTGGHLPLVQELAREGNDNQTLASPAALARLDEDDWISILERPRDPDDPGGGPIGFPEGQKTVRSYARSLTRAVEGAYPTQAVAGRLVRDERPDSPFSDTKTDLSTFFDNNPDFTFGHIAIAAYLQEDEEHKLRGVSDPKALKSQLVQMDRVVKFAPRYEPMRAMLADGVHSAQAVALMGKTEFKRRYSDAFESEDATDTAFTTATTILLVVLNLYLKFSVEPNRPRLDGDDSTDRGTVDEREFPEDDRATWLGLFGSLDLCDCEHCQSLFSPAAYFTDLLVFLRQRTTPYDALIAARPDLAHLELTCDNTDLKLPYIDLVNELLEDAVADPSITVLGDFNAADLDTGVLLDELKQALSLTSRVTLAPDTPGASWVIRDPGWRYLLSMNQAGTGVVARPYPQSAGTEAELAVNPQHVNAAAYEKLSKAGYPWSLPFHLPVEYARAYLAQLGVARHELMAWPKNRSDALADDAIATEYLGLSPIDAAIITGATTGDPSSATGGQEDTPWYFWGLATQNVSLQDPDRPGGDDAIVSGRWDAVLKRVSVFLSQSGLAYRDLLSLLDTQFLNGTLPAGGRKLSIRSLDGSDPATCDTGKLEISGLTADDLKRIHRFVRLQRALGWTARDLDRAIRALAATELTPGFLLQLSHLKWLTARLKLPAGRLLAFWADIDATIYTGVGTSSRDSADLPSLYAALFRSKAVASPIDEAFTEVPSALSGSLADHLPTIFGALQIGASDFSAMTSGTTAVVATPALNLANLSTLYRHATLARSLRLTVDDLLVAKRLIGRDPFAATSDAILFVEGIDAIRASGFDVRTLSWLLRHGPRDVQRETSDDRLSARLLSDLRAGLAKIHDENTPLPDPLGEATQQKLAQLGWHEDHIARVIALCGDRDEYTASLAALPDGLIFPVTLVDRVAHDGGQLRFRGVMSTTDRNALRGASATTGADLTAYQDAVDDLFTLPRAAAKTFMAERMRAFVMPALSAPAGSQRLQAAVSLPEVWNGRVQYQAASGKLVALTPLTEQDELDLLKVSAAPDYQSAVSSLFTQAKKYEPTRPNRFLVSSTDPPNDQAQTAFTDLFDSGKTVAERFDYLLARLCTYLCLSLGESFVKQSIADAFTLEAAVVELLLSRILSAPSDAAKKKATADLLDPVWVRSAGEIVRPSYPNQFAIATRVQKAALLLTRLRVGADDLEQIAALPATAGWLNLDALPVDDTGNAVSFNAWQRLVQGLGLRGAPFTDAAPALGLVLMANQTTVTQEEFLTAVSEAGRWEAAEVTTLAGGPVPAGAQPNWGLLNLRFPDAYVDGSGLVKIGDAFKLLRRLGAKASQLKEWMQPDLADDTPAATKWKRGLANAAGVKNAVKAKLDEAQWLEAARPIQDRLRERQRGALVAYLLAGKHYGRDEIDLYDRLLIDVEMGSCMVTTRIKQATLSVQLFVQRCLMNLEDDVTLTPDEAKEWNTWRRLYRVWEANRKVLLYPENWLEPELRDDKSPFFKDLENELMQNDVTNDTAEVAVLHYLERLDQVARLEIVGMCLQRAPSDPSGTRGTLHVFGRTQAVPHVYFYRSCLLETGPSWTPWERVDLDIEGDHLIPAVWDDRLFLSWPIFTEKTRQQSKQERANNDDPSKYWEIKLAWSESQRGKWLPKRLSKQFLEDDKEVRQGMSHEREDFKFLTYVQTGAFGSRLTVDCYGPAAVNDPFPPPPPTPPTAPRNPVKVLSAGGFELATIVITENGALPRVTDVATLAVTARDPAGKYLYTNNPIVLPLGTVGVAAWETYARDYFVSQEYFTVLKVTPLSSTVGARFVAVDVAPFHRATPAADSPPPIQPYHVITWPVGRFRFDDCRSDVAAIPMQVAEPAIQPAVLKPMKGTRFRDMMMEEYQNLSDVFWTTGMLGKTPGTFRVLPRADSYVEASAAFPFVFQDDRRSYLLRALPATGGAYKARFHTLFHPWVCEYIETLNRSGLRELLTPALQSLEDEPNAFVGQYSPDPSRVFLDDPASGERRAPREDVDFTRQGAYALYNWELFVHVPVLVATKLSKNQRFEEARDWFHYVFDPTSSQPGGRERFWRARPFLDEATQAPQTLADFLKTESQEFKDQLLDWEDNPFRPWVLARQRPQTMMKMIVTKYIENLIEWGDHLFARDTFESINEATLRYILAARILGRQPEAIPTRAVATVQTFASIGKREPNSFFNALVGIESYVFPSGPPALTAGSTGSPVEGTESLGTMPLFCLPKNDKLLALWEMVADRLFKIRHCMNIEGVVRELPIFDPPIDPALLVRAAAAGVDLDSVLSDLYAPLPLYRYEALQRRAIELCNDVRALGASLLAALEKRDAEQLALLRSSHEIDTLSFVRRIREQQAEEARLTLEGLREFEKVATARQQYYLSRPFMNQFEAVQAILSGASLIPMSFQLSMEIAAGVLHLIPNAKMGAPTTIGVTYGGANIASGLQSFAGAMGITSSLLNTMGSLSGTIGGYQRRQDEWTHQADLATKELGQIAKQIAAAEIRVAITRHELQSHELQIEHAKEVDELMRSKYTNAQLYEWMIGQLSAIYFQSYRLAYDTARRTERAYRYELGLADSNMIQFGYWDSLKKGLLAGERLQLDLRRMESDYAERNRREHELTTNVSVLSLDPAALIRLRETGSCEISIPEALFDLECPGHYFRRLKSVSLTIPCVTGPYTGIHCTLTLLKSSVRTSVSTPNGYARDDTADADTRFTDSPGAIQSVVTSSGQNDSGLFETNLRDERYLPFEGAGAISTWRLELPAPKDFPPFDYATITDVILRVLYTARNGGSAFKHQVVDELETAVNEMVTSAGTAGLVRLLDVRREFPTEWHRFLNPAADADRSNLEVTLGADHLPYLFAGRTASISKVQVYVKVAAKFSATQEESLQVAFTAGSSSPAASDDLTLTPWNGLLRGEVMISPAAAITPSDATEWSLTARLDESGTTTPIDAERIDDLFLLMHYSV